MCAHTDKDSAAISAVSFSGTTQIYFTKKSYIKEKKWMMNSVCWLYNASYVGSVNIAAVYVCVYAEVSWNSWHWRNNTWRKR